LALVIGSVNTLLEMVGTSDWFCQHTAQSCGGHLSLPITSHHTYSDVPLSRSSFFCFFCLIS
jgi:hypothetical protein